MTVTKKPPKAPVVAVVASDLHYQERAWANNHRLNWDACLMGHALVNLANQHSCDLILAGDIVDQPTINPLVAGQLMSAMRRLNNHLIFIRGDHDGAIAWPTVLAAGLQNPSRVIELNGQMISVGDFEVTGLPWLPPEDRNKRLPELVTGPVMPDIVVLHHSLQEVASDFEAEMSVEELPAGPRLFIVGDIHKAAALQNSRGQRIVSPGGTNAQQINEGDDKFAYLLRSDLTMTRIRLPSRRIIRATIVGGLQIEPKLDEICHEIEVAMRESSARAEFLPLLPPGETEESIVRPIVQVRYVLGIPGVLEAVQQRLRPLCHLMTQPLDVGADDTAPTIGRLETAGVIGDPLQVVFATLDRRVDRKTNPTLHSDCTMLLRSKLSPKDALLELRRQALP